MYLKIIKNRMKTTQVEKDAPETHHEISAWLGRPQIILVIDNLSWFNFENDKR
jgi:hypothetical protein